MKVLVACEESQAVTIELRKLGHEAFSCDIIECSGGHPEWHIMGDVLPLLDGNCEFMSMDGQKHTQEIQPYEYQRMDDEEQVVHPYTKKTRLWLKGLPKLVPTSPDAVPVGPYCPAGTGRKDPRKYGSAKRGEDAKNRAKTFLGIAKAMAEQWAGEA